MATSNFMLNNRVTQLAKAIASGGGGGSQTLAQVMDLGNTASQDLDMNTNNITNCDVITTTTINTTNLSVDTILSNIEFSNTATFDLIPQCSIIPTVDTDLVNKKYVDDNISGLATLETVLNNGNSAIDKSIILNGTSPASELGLTPTSIILQDTTNGYSLLEYNKLSFLKNTNNSSIEYDGTLDALTITGNTLNLNGVVVLQQGLDMQGEDITNCGELVSDFINVGEINSEVLFSNQTTFNLPPHSTTPILGNDLATKGYVDSLVGQYSGGYNLYFNYSESLIVNSITYKYLSNQVSSAIQQDLQITTDGTDQLLVSFITDEINILEIPAGLWSMVLYGSVSGAGGVLYYYFKIKKNSGGVITDIITSGNSPDVNATPTGNPDAYHMSATIDTPINVLLTDRIIIEIYCIKVSGVNVQLNTYFENAYYSYIQTTLNAGTTLLTSDNNWTANNNFELIPTSETATAGSNDNQLTTTAYIYNTLLDYLTTSIASTTYATLDLLTNYLTSDEISSTYATIDSLTDYLTISAGEATYATISSLSNYLTIASASATYATQTALLGYLRITEAATTYLSIATASTLYYTKTYIDTYLLYTSVADITYANKDDLATNYLPTVNIVATYAPLGAPTFVNGITISNGDVTISQNGLTITNVLMPIKASLVGPATNGVNFGLCSTQTTGTLNIGTGARTTLGVINIGTGAGGTINPINVGSGSSAIKLNGTVELNKALTLPTVSVTPTTTQLGYSTSTSVGPSVAISALTGLLATSPLAIGVYILNFQINIDTCTSGTGTTITISFPVGSNCTCTLMDRKIGGVVNGQSTGGDFTGILICTANTNVCTMSMTVSVGTAIARLYKYSVIKIA